MSNQISSNGVKSALIFMAVASWSPVLSAHRAGLAVASAQPCRLAPHVARQSVPTG